jgi:hypothetical protein
MLKGSSHTGNGWQGKCPAHADNVASLCVSEGRGRTLLKCQAGCDTRDVVRELGIEMSSLFRKPRAGSNGNAALGLDAVYDYMDENGALCYQVVRRTGKKFQQRRPDEAGGWIWNLNGTKPLLYRLPELLEAVALEKLIHVVEGEKDADRLWELGLPATTNSGGAGKWKPAHSEALKGARVVILPDNDDPGRKHAKEVEESLRGVAESTRIVELADLPSKGDVSDWLDAGHTVDALRERIEKAAPSRAEGQVDVPESDRRAFISLAELLRRPELLRPPRAVIPRFSYQGRTTLLVAPDKSGKSTLAAHAAAEASKRGVFLGETIGATTARVVWVGIEEALGDAVSRFHGLAAVPENVEILVLQDDTILEDIRAKLKEWPADLLLLDSLTEYARVVKGTVPDDGDSSGWASVIRPLVHLTREFPLLSSTILHHPRRSDGQFRGSGEIAAAVDCLIEMRLAKDGEDPTIRHLTGRARWRVNPFDVRFRDGRYEMAEGGQALSLDARVLLHIEQNRGVTLGNLRKLVGGRAHAVDEAVHELVRRGAVLDLGSGVKRGYHPSAAGQAGLGVGT